MSANPSSAADPSQHYVGERGAEYVARYEGVMDAHAAVMLPHFQPYVSATDTVVDFGCGTGGLLAALDAAEKIGIEVSASARARAEQRGVPTVESSVEVPTASVDVVVSNHALEHTREPLRELGGLRRILKPEGRLVIWLPLDDWRAREQRRFGPDPNHHLYTWTPLLMGNLLSEAGFTVEVCDIAHWTQAPRCDRALRRLLPAQVYWVMARGLAVVLRRRQLFAVARVAPGSGAEPAPA